MSRRAAVLFLGLITLWPAAGAPASGGEMRIGVELNADPLSFAGPDGRLDGFTVDLINEIALEMKFSTRLIPGAWSDLFARFDAGEIDALLNVGYTKERDAVMDFTTTHLRMSGAVFLRKGGPVIREASELAGLRVATLPESFSHHYLRAHHWDRNLVFVATLRDGLHALNEGRCDALAAVNIIGNHIVRRDGLAQVVNSGIPLDDFTFELHVAVHAGDADRLYMFNEGLARVRANGTYDRLYEKWVGPLEGRALRFKDLKPYALPGAIMLVGILAIFTWQRRLLRQRERQAERLQESEERLRHVLEGSTDGFWDADQRTGHVERSERWAAMLGYTKAEIVAERSGCTALLHPDDRLHYERHLQLLDAGRIERYEIEFRLRAKSGDWRWINDRGKVVARGPDGRPERIAGTHTDITERKRTEAALIESQALLKRSAQLLEQTQALAHIGGWEVDLRSGRLYWTRETFRLHETSPEEYSPTLESAMRFYAPEDIAGISIAMEHASRNGLPYTMEVDLITAKGRRIRVHTTGAAERDGERIVKIYGTFQDITADRNAENEREQLRLKMLEAQKLESLGVLAGGIAHDFNNLLTVILANATFVRGDRAKEDEPIAHIESAARRAADLCRQMLAYAGKGSFVVEQTELGALVRDTAQLIRVSISKKAHLELDLASNLTTVQGDVSQLRQVVMNLVINASEALGDGAGEIRIATRAARPDPTTEGLNHSFDLPAGDCVCLEIADTGQGMGPATLARIFDPFFTTKFAGRGLGLAAVLGIVRAHRGALTVQSAPGHGSKFRLFLPASSRLAAPATAAPVVTAPMRSGTGTILIADDEPSVLATASSVLRHHGFTTVLANDGHEAVRHFRANPAGFAAVLLDLTMPGLDGAEVLRQIRAIHPAARVLVMSGFSEHDVLARLHGLGDVAFLRKPFTLQTLVTRVSEIAGRS